MSRVSGCSTRLLASVRAARAFTLIELLVVILIVGILIAVAAPSFLGQIGKADDSAAQQYLTVAYKAAKAYSTDGHDGNGDPVPSFTSQGNFDGFDDAVLTSFEPGLTSEVGLCPDHAIGQDHNHIVIEVASGNDLTMCADPENNIWTLRVVNGALQPLSLQVVTGDGPPPRNFTAPAASGNAQEGFTLTGTTGNWSNVDEFDYQWQRGEPWADIAGAAASSYVLTTADIGHRLRVCVTGQGAGGSTGPICSSAHPSSGTVLPSPPVQSGAGPQITGLAQEGETLTVSNGTWSSSQPLTYARQWLSCTSATELSSCANVGADQATYIAQASDIGNFIRVRVTATDTYEQSMIAYADATTAVASAVPVGVVLADAGQSIPSGWLEADGSAVNRSTYSELYTVIGTSYGAGDGSTTFNLPNLSGKMALGKADAGTASTLGAGGGNLTDSGSVSVGNFNYSFSWTESLSAFSFNSHSHGTSNALVPRWRYSGGSQGSDCGPCSGGRSGISIGNASETATPTGNPSGTATGSASVTAAYQTTAPPYRVLKQIIKVSTTASATSCAVWPSARVSAASGSVAADGSPASGSVASCLAPAFAGNTPDLEGRFAVGQAASGPAATLNGAAGALDQSASVVLDTASTQANVTLQAPLQATINVTHGTHSFSLSGADPYWTGGLELATSGPSSNTIDRNGSATVSTSVSPALGASGNGKSNAASAQTVTSSSWRAPYFALDYRAFTGTSVSAGTLTAYAGQNLPSGWLRANGACISTATYPDLFAAIQYQYGGSGGSFCLPDLRGKLPIGRDAGNTALDVLGDSGGTLSSTPQATLAGWTPSLVVGAHTFSWSVPAHRHALVFNPASPSMLNGDASGGGFLVRRSWNTDYNNAGTAVTASHPQIAQQTVNGAAVGSQSATLPAQNAPYRVLNYLIKS